MGGAVFPPCYLTWGQTMVEVMKIMATSFKRYHACTAALSAPDPAAGHCWPVPPQETLKHSSGSVFVGSLGPIVHKVSLNPLSISGGMGFDSKCDFPPPTVLLRLLLCPWTWVSFFGRIQHSPVDGCSAASCNFGVLTGEDQCTSFYSAMLVPHGLYIKLHI